MLFNAQTWKKFWSSSKAYLPAWCSTLLTYTRLDICLRVLSFRKIVGMEKVLDRIERKPGASCRALRP